MSDGTVGDRLRGAGLDLPGARPPAGAYASVVVDGDHVYTSGAVSVREGVVVAGRLGDDVDVAGGQRAAALACLQALANIEAEVGDLARVGRVLKATGYVRCTPDFTSLSAVVDGASEVLLTAFGERGRGARSAIGVASLPLGACVELELVLALRP
ncbi:MAG TPA: RidA family protein [Ilumatobacter sp.]|nr:RidA family protein [Ilumatobacter sp.]